MISSTKPQGCTNLKLRQLGRMVTRHYDQYMAGAGLKNTQYALLSHVVKLGPIRPGDLAKRMQMDASTLTRNLQPMVARGWLAVRAGHDARSRFVEATPLGLSLRAQAFIAWKEAQRALNARFGVDRVAALHDLLDSCMSSLEEESNDASPY